MTLRERIEDILMREGVEPSKVPIVATQLVSMGRGRDVKHQIGPNGYHRLIVNGEKSQWTPPTEIIRIGDLIASTDVFINQLPQVGKVFQLKDPDFVTESVQTLGE